MNRFVKLYGIANGNAGAARTNFTSGTKYNILMAAEKKCAANVPGFQCDRDGKVLRHHQVDHIVPTYVGGPSTIDNGQILCLECHHEKSRLELRIFPRKNSRSFLFKRRNVKLWLKAIVLKKPSSISKIVRILKILK